MTQNETKIKQLTKGEEEQGGKVRETATQSSDDITL